ncbi:hypothetical protein M1Z66_000966 [Clostridium perfringens]
MKSLLKEKISIFKVPIILFIGCLLMISLNKSIYKENKEDFKEKYIKAERDCNALELENNKAKERKEAYMELKNKYDELSKEYSDYEENTSKALDKKIEELKREIGE